VTAAKLALTKQLVEHGITSSCMNCEHFSLNQDSCTLYSMKPPTQVLVVGCDSWTFDIPF